VTQKCSVSRLFDDQKVGGVAGAGERSDGGSVAGQAPDVDR
jgi:hypothetical protein